MRLRYLTKCCFLYQNHIDASKCMACQFVRQISQSSVKPNSSPSAILIDKSIPILPVIGPDSLRSTDPALDAKSVDKLKWLETKINIKDLHLHYLKLSKSRLTSLVVMTTLAGYTMAPAPFDLATMVLCCTGTGLVSAAANSINQYHEVPFDSQMSRTKNRVLVKGILSPLHALMFATVSGSLGLVTLYYGVNPVSAALGAANLFLYTSIYTPMKRISIANTWIGSIAAMGSAGGQVIELGPLIVYVPNYNNFVVIFFGAIPPLMGWAGCTGGIIDSGGLLLAGLLYAWQFPHFNALSWNLRPDYSRAGYRMMAVTNPGLCRRTALRYTISIFGLCSVAPLCDLTNVYFSIAVAPLNAYFIYLAWKFHQESDSKTSRKLFRFSLIHLPALMILLLVNKHGMWSENRNETENSEFNSTKKDQKKINVIFKTPEPL